MRSCLLNKILRIVLILLITVCIYDPADKLLGLKVPLFTLAWFLFIIGRIANRNFGYFPINMIMYLLLFMLIPLVSMSYYSFSGSDFIHYDGYQYLKSYLFITVVLIIYLEKIDLIKPTILIITSMSILSVIIIIICYFNFNLASSFHEVGARYGILYVGPRVWGGSILPDLQGVYFHTAELIVFPIGYFTMKTFFSRGSTKLIYELLLVINVVAMFFSATRNNIAACLFVPILIISWYCKRTILAFFIIIALTFIAIISNTDIIKDVLDPESYSNSVKLSYVKDYLNLFADEKVLLFGQGLGSYFNTTRSGYVSLTELTYFEFIRRFGLILSLASFALFLYPISKLTSKEYHSIHYLLIVYLFFLVMCFFNPLLMSSSGMLLLAIVLYKVFSPTSIAIQNKLSHQVSYRDQACVST